MGVHSRGESNSRFIQRQQPFHPIEARHLDARLPSLTCRQHQEGAFHVHSVERMWVPGLQRFRMQMRLPERCTPAGGVLSVRRRLQLQGGVQLQKRSARRRPPVREPIMQVETVPVLAGIVLSVGVAVFARLAGFDRDRAFYPTVLMVIASYYVLFAVMSGSVEALVIESAVMTLFAAAAVAGFKSSAWIVVAALAGHGVFDAVHGHIIENAGVPAWWPAWCFAYDVGAAAVLGWLLQRGPTTNDARA